jgi:hypothetical protein
MAGMGRGWALGPGDVVGVGVALCCPAAGVDGTDCPQSKDAEKTMTIKANAIRRDKEYLFSRSVSNR